MLVKLKLKQILNRIKLVHKKSTYSEDYNKGFKHAIDLFAVSMDIEFGKWCEDQDNLHEQIRQLKLQVLGENGENSKQLFQINRLKAQIELVQVLELTKSQQGKLAGFLSMATGLPYGDVQSRLLDGIKIKRANGNRNL